jgi:hypothetical protein
VNTYSDQRTDVSVFGAGFTDDNRHGRLCNLSGDHVSGDLDTIASRSCGGCDRIASGGHVCGVRDVDLDGGIASGVHAFDGGRISGARVVSYVNSGGQGGCKCIASGGRAATALPAAEVVAGMLLPAAAAFVVFATSISIVELPAAFAPLMAAVSTTRALPAMLPSMLMSVRSLRA